MSPLFTSYACDWCDGLRQDTTHRGYVLWRVESRPGDDHYVFPDVAQAQRFADGAGITAEIRPVAADEPFEWVPGRGTIAGLMLARHRYAIYADWRRPAGGLHANLVQEQAHQVAA